MSSSLTSLLHDRRVDAGHVAHEAEPLVAHLDLDEPGVLAREPDRERAVLVERGDDLAVDLADQRHAHDVDGLGVGDAQAVDELGLLAQPLHEVGDLRAAAVHDDRVHADEAHEHDVLREQVGERGVVHGVAAVLDDDGACRANSRMYGSASARIDCLLEDRRGADHDVPMFSSTYAWVRSVNSMVASPLPWCRSQAIVEVALLHRRRHRVGVVRGGDAVAAHDDAVRTTIVDVLGVEHRAAHAELGEHATPVRVLAVERALHELAATPPCRAASCASWSLRAPRTCRVTHLVAPSASAAIWCARSAHAAVSASTKRVVRGAVASR